MEQDTRTIRLVSLGWIMQVGAALTFVLAALPKFVGTNEAQSLFLNLGVEPRGRIITGVVEVLAAALLLHPATARAGGFLGMAIMVGAFAAHVLRLGFSSFYGVFALFAVLVFCICACIVLCRSSG
jgi:hypothetical protein